jgi:hypothetical protein
MTAAKRILCACSLALVAACGSSSGDPGAADAASAADGAVAALDAGGQTPDASSACDCTPSQACVERACVCPQGFVPDPLTPLLTQVDAEREAPNVLAIVIFTGTDAKLHAVVAGYHPEQTAVATDLDLAASPTDAPYVALAYAVNPITQTNVSAFRSTAGTMHLTRRCASGAAGSITGVLLSEVSQDEGASGFLEGGCTYELPAIAFDIGGACE